MIWYLYIVGVASQLQWLKSLGRATKKKIDFPWAALVILTWPVSMPIMALWQWLGDRV